MPQTDPFAPAILIVTHNSASVIGACLQAIPDSGLPSVIVIDNASTDRTAQIVQDLGIRLIQRSRNDGFGTAANEAAAAATARFLLFLNPDCILPQDFFARAAEALKAGTEDCFVPQSLDEGTSLVDGRQPGYTRWKLVDDILHSNYGPGFLTSRIRNLPGYHNPSWHWPHGACLMISRERFFSIGGFDPRFFLYMEDVDLGLRLQEAGCNIRTLDCRVAHARSSGTSIGRQLHLSLLNRGRIRYAEIHYGPFLPGLLKLLELPALAYRMIAQRVGATT